MTYEAKSVRPAQRERRVIDQAGQELEVPKDWVLVPPGDAAMTRRIKTGGPSWMVQDRKGRRTFSKGVWAEALRVQAIAEGLKAERAEPAHAKRLASGRARRERAENSYSAEFEQEVRRFLCFHLRFDELEERLAKSVSEHATPVGSGTVARTKRIPVGERAEAAVIAWLRHQTTAYDSLKIARVRGRRREVRRALAARSRELLDGYRRGDEPAAACPLRRALDS
ncbi:MAG: hypothetical protein ACI8X5_003786 [Planctomycetota bacterium]|jgi:hypothetical protein